MLVGGLGLSRLSLGTDVAIAEAAPRPQPVPARLAAPALVRGGQPGAGPRTEQIGRSRGGQPLTIFQIGTGRQHVLILGGQHGAPEANTVVLTDAILDTFTSHPGAVPKSITLDILTLANPDGFLAGSRQYLSGVDPNRNWDEADWQPDAYDSLGRFGEGLGGPAPMSEPETRLLAAWIMKRRPALVINYHSAGGLVSTRQPGLADDLSSLYADAGAYPYSRLGGPGPGLVIVRLSIVGRGSVRSLTAGRCPDRKSTAVRDDRGKWPASFVTTAL